MDRISDILGKSADADEDQRQLLMTLSKHLQDGGFCLVSNNGSTVSSGQELNLSEEILNGLVERCKKGESTVNIDCPGSLPVHAMHVGEMDAVLIFVLPDSPASETESYGTAAVRLCVELFFMQKKNSEGQKLLSIQKKQADRTVHAIETKYRDNLESLVRATEKSEAANIAKREFLANISHEMRTPLNGIIGLSDLALEDELDNDQMDLLTAINTEASSLHKLINDVLDFSKIEAGKLELEEIAFNLRHLMDDLAVSFFYRAEQKGLEFISFVAPDIPEVLIGDPGRTRQIITNLAGNALKFTDKGEIYVGAEVAEDLDDRLMLKFVIKDTGVGIQKEKQAIIFDPFMQADGSTTRKFGGTGLGTAISKQLVELMGGEIGVESEEGNGSTFWFTALCGKQKEQKDLLCEQEYDLSDLKVAVVSAKSNNRFILSEYLRAWGCQLVEADEGKKALAVLRESHSSKECCDLVITGTEMQDMSGFDMAREIREDNNLKNIPIIVLTSRGWRGDGKICSDIGIDGYLPKPVTQEDLYKIIVSVMGCLRKEQVNITREVITRHTIAEEEAKRFRILVVEDYPTNQKVIKRYLGRAGYRVDVADNGLEGLKAFKRTQYNIVFMDMAMPVMDGYEATVKIRKFESQRAISSLNADPHVPIIAITAHAEKGDRQKCLDAGADDYMTKPFERETLLVKVAEWLKQEPAVSDGTMDAPGQEQIQEHSADDSPMNYEYALDQYEGDRDFLIEVLTEFLEHAASQISDIKQAVSEGNREVVRREAHSIKGGSSILTANDLSDVAYELQLIGESGSLEGSDEAIERLEKEFHCLEAYAKSL